MAILYLSLFGFTPLHSTLLGSVSVDLCLLYHDTLCIYTSVVLVLSPSCELVFSPNLTLLSNLPVKASHCPSDSLPPLALLCLYTKRLRTLATYRHRPRRRSVSTARAA